MKPTAKQLKARTEFPQWAKILEQEARLYGLCGGRGSSKSWTVARWILKQARQKKMLILCAREFQNSIRQSVHRLLRNQIHLMGYEGEFTCGRDSILHKGTGSEIVFCGIQQNIDSIRSMEGLDLVWIEEGQAVSKSSWETLEPTIRKKGSKIIITWNNKTEKDVVYTMFFDEEGEPRYGATPGKDEIVFDFINWDQNPWFPDVLRKQMERDRRRDPDKFRHVWEGQPVRHSEEQVFSGVWSVGKVPEPPEGTKLYYGLDFSNGGKDPFAAVRCWIDDKTLYLDRESFGHWPLESLPEQVKRFVGTDLHAKIFCDSARPDAIAYLCRHGLDCHSARKGKDSIIHGVDFMRSFDIVVDEKCKNLIGEFSAYRFKTDPRTGEVLPVIVDKDNHGIDSARYSLSERIRQASYNNSDNFLGNLPFIGSSSDPDLINRWRVR